jgi:hypothetical protein
MAKNVTNVTNVTNVQIIIFNLPLLEPEPPLFIAGGHFGIEWTNKKPLCASVAKIPLACADDDEAVEPLGGSSLYIPTAAEEDTTAPGA